MLSLKYAQRLNEVCESPTPERDALRLIKTICRENSLEMPGLCTDYTSPAVERDALLQIKTFCEENSPGSVDGHSTVIDFVWTVANTVLGDPLNGFCSPAGRKSCLHSRPWNRCSDCPVADDPTVTLPGDEDLEACP